MSRYTTIDEYIKDQPELIARRLTLIRELFHLVVPDTGESILYDMMAFTVGSDHLYVGALKQHIGMYPMYNLPQLEDEMSKFRGKGTKDALQFPYAKPLPVKLITKIIYAKSKQ